MFISLDLFSEFNCIKITVYIVIMISTLFHRTLRDKAAQLR
jgi:hypothetical protein